MNPPWAKPPAKHQTPTGTRANTFDRQFVEVARSRPDRTAVACGDDWLTYDQVLRAAVRIAEELQDVNIPNESDPVVAVALHRGVAVLPVVIGCWLAGMGVLPIDLDISDGRLKFILADSRPVALLTHDRNRNALSRLGFPTLGVDQMLTGSASSPSSRSESMGLAYVIYTSGSTGNPKGVAIEQRNLVAYSEVVTETLGCAEDLAWMAVSSFATDLAYTALFPPLLCGGTVHIVPKDVAIDPAALGRYVQRHDIAAIKVTPSHMAALLSGSEDVIPRRLLVFGGEALAWQLVDQVRSIRGDCLVFNHYGPTETTVGACVYDCREQLRAPGSVPIGRPLPHVIARVLDESGHPINPNGVGELWIGGAGVGRGYVGHAADQVSGFVCDSSTNGLRFYRTGDRIRVLSDRVLQFVGRSDAQVKVRGYRVELEEIEALLNAHPSIRRAAVAPRSGPGAATGGLVAYVIPATASFNTEVLLAELATRLPDYMVPSQVALVSDLQLTASGKLDRARLPQELDANHEPEPQGLGLAQAENSVRRIMEIFKRILGISHVSEDDDFFAIGGDSLLAVHAVSEIRREFATDVPIAALFMNPTPRDLSGAIASGAASDVIRWDSTE